MSLLFTPASLGGVELPNRLVRSATYEGAALPDGGVGDELLRLYERLAQGGAGLIITGYLFVEPPGKALPRQMGAHDPALLSGLTRLVEVMHQHGARVALQLAHAGRQTTRAICGERPQGPSWQLPDALNQVSPRAMREDDIARVIAAFGRAAGLAQAAGADFVQIHAAHGYLVNQFLSPFFNRRRDAWGGNDANRFRFLREIIAEVRRQTGADYPLLVKLNAADHTPRPGLTPPLAARYAAWLAELAVAGVEVSGGTAFYSFFQSCRGEVPVEELAAALPAWQRPVARYLLGRMRSQEDHTEGYNLPAAALLRPALGPVPLIAVGGLRTREALEGVLARDEARLVSLSRPFLRQPALPRLLARGDLTRVSCTSCNLCLAALVRGEPVACRSRGGRHP
ncbi:MAG: NADH:flavin oxidoreductase [Deltaproteobacteria bacterium]|nr:NADH:flavin oxidoreductase [Deltaproteobacteria bacterium]